MQRWQRRRVTAALLAALIVGAGIVWRMAPLGLPLWAFKYGGSVLWATAIYWVLVAVMPRVRPVRVAMVAALIAAAIEVFKLYDPPAVDAFRRTLAGKLILGRFFSLWDIAAYWLAIALAAVLDAATMGSRKAGVMR